MLMIKYATKEILGNYEPLDLHSLFMPLVPNPHSVKDQEKAPFSVKHLERVPLWNSLIREVPMSM